MKVKNVTNQLMFLLENYRKVLNGVRTVYVEGFTAARNGHSYLFVPVNDSVDVIIDNTSIEVFDYVSKLNDFVKAILNE